MMRLEYPCHLTPENDGSVTVTFPDVPEAMTCGLSRAAALAEATDALSVALTFYLEAGEALPTPSDTADELIDSLGEALGLSQARFARLLGVSTSGLRKWEQGDRTPRGASATLLRVMEREPEAVTRALLEEQRRGGGENRAG